MVTTTGHPWLPNGTLIFRSANPGTGPGVISEPGHRPWPRTHHPARVTSAPVAARADRRSGTVTAMAQLTAPDAPVIIVLF